MNLTFLLAKDPTSERVGDTMLMNQVIGLSADDHEVSVICWSDVEDSDDRIMRLRKPPVSPLRIGVRALTRNRSLLHARYDDPALRDAIEGTDADAYVAVHHYMAEAFLRSTRADRPLYVLNVVPEAPIWRHTRGLLGRVQAGAIERDEARVLRRAMAVGSYDAADAADAADSGAARSVWLDLTLPPAVPADVATSLPRLVVLGDRTWAPNEAAWQRMLTLWPEISAGIEGAELLAVGRPAASRHTPLPPGVRDLGFVDNLHDALASCRALVAPIEVGGGVRVKLLEAAAMGLPVVATSSAVGSLDSTLGIEPVDDPADFVAACRRLLLDPSTAATEGRRLYEMNRRHDESGRARQSIRAWLAP